MPKNSIIEKKYFLLFFFIIFTIFYYFHYFQAIFPLVLNAIDAFVLLYCTWVTKSQFGNTTRTTTATAIVPADKWPLIVQWCCAMPAHWLPLFNPLASIVTISAYRDTIRDVCLRLWPFHRHNHQQQVQQPVHPSSNAWA